MEKITVLGGGISGIGASFLAKKKGFEVFLSDKGKLNESDRFFLIENNINFEENTHTEDIILSSDLIIKSPGISNNTDIIKKIREKKIPIISEIEFASRYSKGFIIAITGSNGKTTTTSLIYHIMKNLGLDVSLCGNIGKSFAFEVAQGNREYYVIEVSSFQLDDINSFKPNISLIINLSPDHLDRYDYSFEKYSLAKLNIANYQTEKDILIYNEDDRYLSELLGKKNIQAKKIGISIDKEIHLEKDKLQIKGIHNLYNIYFAYQTVKNLGISEDKIKESIYTFKPVEHRLEFVRNILGVEYINDSKATNVDSTFYALEAMEKEIIWIVGGTDKGNDYSKLDKFIPKIKSIICMGVDNTKLLNYYSNKIEYIYETKSMEETINKAKQISKEGEVVLLSPCCASFDLFKNYEDRGEQFKYFVNKI